jgi:zinc protease
VVAAVAQTFGKMAPREVPLLPAVMPQARISGEVQLEARIDTEDQKADLFLVYPTTDGLDDRRRRHLSFLGLVVDDRLRLRVREELGAAYSPSASAESSQTWLGLGAILMQASGDPAQAQELLAACQAVGQELASEGITQEEVDRLAEPVLKQLRDSMRANGYWIDALKSAQTRPASLDSAASLLDAYANLDLAYLNELAAEFLGDGKASWLLVQPLVQD